MSFLMCIIKFTQFQISILRPHGHVLLHGFPGFLMLDFFPPKEILKLFCIVKTFTCFLGADICVLLINAVDLDAVIPDDVGTATVLIFVVG